MTVDYRCLVSGVSLLGAETMGLLCAASAAEGPFLPCALPLWGRYEGNGSLAEVQVGPNAEVIVRAFHDDIRRGEARIDWSDLGVAPVDLDHIETLLAVVRTNSIHGLDAVRWRGRLVDLALVQADVAAALMQDEPARLSRIPVDELPQAVVEGSPIFAEVMRLAFSRGPKMRCKFGLSLVSLASFVDQLDLLGVTLGGPQHGIQLEMSEPARWLAEAYQHFSTNDPMRQALDEYVSGLTTEEDELESQD